MDFDFDEHRSVFTVMHYKSHNLFVVSTSTLNVQRVLDAKKNGLVAITKNFWANIIIKSGKSDHFLFIQNKHWKNTHCSEHMHFRFECEKIQRKINDISNAQSIAVFRCNHKKRLRNHLVFCVDAFSHIFFPPRWTHSYVDDCEYSLSNCMVAFCEKYLVPLQCQTSHSSMHNESLMHLSYVRIGIQSTLPFI